MGWTFELIELMKACGEGHLNKSHQTIYKTIINKSFKSYVYSVKRRMQLCTLELPGILCGNNARQAPCPA